MGMDLGEKRVREDHAVGIWVRGRQDDDDDLICVRRRQR